MIKFKKRIEKEYDIMERNYQTVSAFSISYRHYMLLPTHTQKLAQAKSTIDGYMSLIRRTLSSEPVSSC